MKMERKQWNFSNSYYFLGVISAVLFLAGVQCQGLKHPEQALLEKMFDGGRYDARVRPLNGANTTDPVLVSVNFFLRRVNKIDDKENEFSIQLTFRQRWKDERLSYSTGGSNRVPFVSLLNPQSKIWRPDTFFSNEKEGSFHELMTRNEFVRIHPNGEILHSALISLRLYCPMNFRDFPFDRQTCFMRLASYGYTTNDVKYQWKKETPVELGKNIAIPQFSLEGMETSYCDSITSTGSYSCLRVDFTLQRSAKWHLIHVYIPCVNLTIVSWVAFWISIQAITARIIINIISLVVLFIHTGQVNQAFPSTSHTKSVDFFTGICLTFVFAALLETATVHYLTRRKERRNSATNVSSNHSGSAGALDAEANVTTEPNNAAAAAVEQIEEVSLKDLSQGDELEKEGQEKPSSNETKKNAQEIIQDLRERGLKYLDVMETQYKNIDLISRIVFPGLFFIFLILYLIAASI